MKKLILVLVLVFLSTMAMADDRMWSAVSPGENPPFTITSVKIFQDPDATGPGTIMITGDEVEVADLTVGETVKFFDFIGSSTGKVFYIEVTYEGSEVVRSDGTIPGDVERAVFDLLLRNPQ